MEVTQRYRIIGKQKQRMVKQFQLHSINTENWSYQYTC